MKMRMGILRQTKRPDIIALSFGFFTIGSKISIRKEAARRDGEFPTPFRRDQIDRRIAMQLVAT
jgi:hypothetical protein